MNKQYLVNCINMAIIAIYHGNFRRDLKENEIMLENEQDISNLSSNAQVKLYNNYAEVSIKVFKDKSTGTARLLQMLDYKDLIELKNKDSKVHLPLEMVENSNILVRKHRKSNKLYKLMDCFMASPGVELTPEDLLVASSFTEKSLIVRISILNNHHNMNIVRNKETGGFTFNP